MAQHRSGVCKTGPWGMNVGELLLALAVALAGVSSTTAGLWGPGGREYVAGPSGRLLDYSYAGYAAGEADIPRLRPTANVKDFGALGDGETDDTEAFKDAIASVGTGVLFIPPGRYIILEQLQITTRLSLRGNGPDQSVLCFPLPLGEIKGDGGYKSKYSFGEGLISYVGAPYRPSSKVGEVVGYSLRGTNSLEVTSVGDITPGQWVSVTISNQEGWLFEDMNQAVDPGCLDGPCIGKNLFAFTSRVAAVPNRNTLVLERPLPFNVSEDFAPASVYKWAPQLSNVGVESLGLEMWSNQYEGHWTEAGFNGIQFRLVHNSWIRDVKITGADVGITLASSSFITVSFVRLTAPDDRFDYEGNSGHFGIQAVSSSDCLIQDIAVDTKFIHDLSVNWFSRGVVFSRAYGQNLNMDHHRAGTYGILWTEINVGRGAFPFASGGDGGRGLNAGSFTTYWNIFTANGQPFGRGPVRNFGPYLNFVGAGANTPYPALNTPVMASWYIDTSSPRSIPVRNLYQSQRSVRMASKNKVSFVLGGLGRGGARLA